MSSYTGMHAQPIHDHVSVEAPRTSDCGRDIDAFYGVSFGVLLSLPLWVIIGIVVYALI